jgi:hypothetical protein
MMANHQWSGIHKEDVDRWISNFYSSSDELKSLAYTLLINIIYYSETDIITALKEGINNLLFRDIILQRQIDSHFTLSKKALFNIRKDELDVSCFVPLLDNNAPHESANSMSRLLVQQNIIRQEQSLFLQDLHVENMKYKRIVIIDDCVGSGDQLDNYWHKNAKININGSAILLKDFCTSNPNLEVNYLTLFGYTNSIGELQKKLTNIKIFCVNLLVDAQRVFSEESYIWQNNELADAKAKFNDLLIEKGVPLLGYKGLDFALVMDGTIPNWSLPMLYKETSDWKPLLRRKTTI